MTESVKVSEALLPDSGPVQVITAADIRIAGIKKDLAMFIISCLMCANLGI
jgi:hypothetical protein